MGTWIQRAPMPTPRHDLQSIAIDGTIYAISGADDLTVDAVEIYDVASDTWTQGPPIPTKRGWLGAARIGRRIYVAGGKTIRTPEEKKAYGHDYHFTSRDNLEMLDLDEQTWSALAPMPGGPRAGLAVTACQDQIWAIGGNTMLREDPRILDRVEVYDVATDTWGPGPDLPRPTQGPTVATHDGLIYLTGGISDEDPQRPCRSETYVLDPAVGRWEALAPVPTGRESSGSCVLGDLLYTFGGKDPHYSAATEIYDIQADRWFEDAPMPLGKAWLSACVVGERPFVMGGAHKWEDREGYNWIGDLHEFAP